MRFNRGIWIKPKRDSHRFRHPKEIGVVYRGHFCAMLGVYVTPVIVPIKTIVEFEAETLQPTGNSLPTATRKWIERQNRIATAIKAVIIGIVVFFDEITQLTKVPLLGTLRRVVMRP